MGFSVFSWIIPLLVLFLPSFLLLVIKPSGPNRFGMPGRPLSFGDAVARCFSKYVGFQGRAMRSEYWWFYLAYFIVAVVAAIVALVSGIREISQLAGLVFLLPLLAVGARRLHDINRSAWWLLLMLTGVGIFTLLILYMWPSQKDDAAEVF